MALRTVERIDGSVTIKSNCRDGTLHLTYWSPAAGRIVQRSAQTRDLAAARKAARALAREIAAGRPAATNAPALRGIHAAMADAIKYGRSRTDHHRENMADFANYFIEYLAVHHPGLRRWDQVTHAVLRAYVDHLITRGLKPKTIRHYCSPVTVASNFWHRENPDIYRRLEIVHPYLSDGPAPAKHYLTGPQLAAALLVATPAPSPAARLAILLGGYAGLNLLEIASVRDTDLDLPAGTVTVTRAKTKFRPRTIPLLPLVVAGLRDILATRKVIRADGYLVPTLRGAPPTDATFARPLHRTVFPAVGATHAAPKDLRKSFVNLMVQAGVPDTAAAAYIGHSPATTLGRHYADLGRLDYLRREVTDRVAAHIANIAPAAILDVQA